MATMEFSRLRRHRRLVHRGRRRPRPHATQRPARLGRPGGGGPGRRARTTSGTPTSPSAGASCTRSSTSSSSPRSPCDPTWSRRTPGRTTSCGRGSTSTPSPRRTTRRSAGSPRTGATVVLFTAFDPGGSAIYRPLRGRFALYTEAVREIAERHGTRARRLLADARVPRVGLLGHRPDAHGTGRPPAHGHAGPRRPRRAARSSRSCRRRRTRSSAVASCARRTSQWARTHAVPVGAPPPHRAVLRRQRLPQATRRWPRSNCLRVG